MRKWLTVIVFVIVGFLVSSAIKAVFKHLAELDNGARKALAAPQVIRFADGTTDEDEFPSRPSVRVQLDGQSREVVICGTPSVSEHDGVNCTTTTIEVVDRIVDARYLSGTGNLRDVVRWRLRPGLGRCEQIRLAFCELGNCLCFGAYTSLLAGNEIESGRGIRRSERLIHVREITRKTVEDAEFSETGRDERVSRRIERRPWYKPDIYHDKKEICTTEQRERATVVVEKCTRIHVRDYDCMSLPTTSTEVRALVVRQTLERMNKWTESEKSYHGWKWLCGKGLAISDKDVDESEGFTCANYVFKGPVLDFESFQTVAELKHELESQESFKTREIVLDPVVCSYLELTSDDRFEEGGITLFTGGSIVNLFIKTDLGYELSVMDWVWAGVDVADIAIIATTGGSGTGVAVAGKAAAKAVVKQGAKLAVRASAKAAGKAAAGASTRVMVRRAAKAAGREFAIDGMALAGNELYDAIAGDGSEARDRNPGEFRELPEEWLNGTADMNNIPNASYVFPLGREASFRTDANGVRL